MLVGPCISILNHGWPEETRLQFQQQQLQQKQAQLQQLVFVARRCFASLRRLRFGVSNLAAWGFRLGVQGCSLQFRVLKER